MKHLRHKLIIRHPFGGKSLTLMNQRVAPLDLPDLVTKAMALAFAAGIPSWLAARRNLLVKRKVGLFRWEVVPRAEWEPFFKTVH